LVSVSLASRSGYPTGFSPSEVGILVRAFKSDPIRPIGSGRARDPVRPELGAHFGEVTKAKLALNAVDGGRVEFRPGRPGITTLRTYPMADVAEAMSVLAARTVT
jgi:hypothetical protein